MERKKRNVKDLYEVNYHWDQLKNRIKRFFTKKEDWELYDWACAFEDEDEEHRNWRVGQTLTPSQIIERFGQPIPSPGQVWSVTGRLELFESKAQVEMILAEFGAIWLPRLSYKSTHLLIGSRYFGDITIRSANSNHVRLVLEEELYDRFFPPNLAYDALGDVKLF